MQHPPSFDDGRPPFDHAFAQELLGKHVLVGITFRDPKQTDSKSIASVANARDRSNGCLRILGRSRRRGPVSIDWRVRANWLSIPITQLPGVSLRRRGKKSVA